MTDKRELILQRLLVRLATVSGATARRNDDQVSERGTPVVTLFDGDEEAASEAFELGRRSGRSPNLVAMTPEVHIDLGAVPETVGTDLNGFRIEVMKAVLQDDSGDDSLYGLVGANGAVRYIGCGTELHSGKTIMGQAWIGFQFVYALKPDEL